MQSRGFVFVAEVGTGSVNISRYPRVPDDVEPEFLDCFNHVCELLQIDGLGNIAVGMQIKCFLISDSAAEVVSINTGIRLILRRL